MLKFRHVAILLVSLMLAGCKLAILNPKGIIAAAEQHVLVFSTLLMLIIVIPVIVMTFVIAWRYRESNPKAKFSPEWTHSTLLEIICWAVPCLIIAILATITWTSTHKLDPYRPLANKEKPIIIQAIALDWKWLFIYPAQRLATVNYLQLPVNKPVRFLITADAPMNSLEIPQLAGQIYAMTGMRTKLNILATEVGKYTGLSTNFSGEGFAEMHFTVQVSSQQHFEKWVTRMQHSPQQLTLHTYNQLIKPSQRNPAAFYSQPAHNLFNIVLMKYMGPDMKQMLDNGEPKPTTKPQHLSHRN